MKYDTFTGQKRIKHTQLKKKENFANRLSFSTFLLPIPISNFPFSFFFL